MEEQKKGQKLEYSIEYGVEDVHDSRRLNKILEIEIGLALDDLKKMIDYDEAPKRGFLNLLIESRIKK